MPLKSNYMKNNYSTTSLDRATAGTKIEEQL